MFGRFARLIYKTVLSILLVLFFIAVSAVLLILPFDRYRRRSLLALNNSICSRIMIRILSIKARFYGEDKFTPGRAWYIMGNHVSFVDVFLVVAKFRTLLITSTEMKRRAVLGQLAVMGGCLFVERRKIMTLRDEIPEINTAFRKNLNVCLFPESTCSDGRALLPFKSALMSAVSGTGAGILPVCIMYRRINGKAFTPEDFRMIGYFGGMKFAPQFIKVMMLKSLEVELEILDPVEPGTLDRKEISEIVFERISGRYDAYLSGLAAEA